MGEKLNGQSFTIIRQAGESGVLYGSVSARDLAETLSAGGFTVGREQIALNAPIKSLGLHAVPVALHPEVEATVTINVARSQDEAERQARGENVIASQFDEERAHAEQAAQDLFEGGAGQAMADAPSEG